MKDFMLNSEGNAGSSQQVTKPTVATGTRETCVIPVISLWMPWANWVILGWKKIETRRHRRFAGLEGKVIGIHATLKWDDTALEQSRPYLKDWQIARTKDFLRIGGGIIGTAYVISARELCCWDSERALIDCASTKRHGLILESPQMIPVIPCRGKQGIWYHDISGQQTNSSHDHDR